MTNIISNEAWKLANAVSNCFNLINWNINKEESFSTFTKYYFNAKAAEQFNKKFQELFNSINCLNYWSQKGTEYYMVVNIKHTDFEAVIGYLLLNRNKY